MIAWAYADCDSRIETLTGDETITDVIKLKHVQVLDPGGASRNITLPDVALSKGLILVFINSSSGAFNLVLKDENTNTVLTVSEGQTGLVLCDGVAWYAFPESGSFTSATLVTPTISGAAVLDANATITCLAGTTGIDLSLGTGTFKTPTGLHTLGGAVTINDATTPYLVCAAGKTNTGYVEVMGKTSGGVKYTTADATAYLVTSTVAAQTTGTATVTLPDCAGVSQNYVLSAAQQTLTNKTLQSATITGGLTISDVNVVLSATTGTKIGTATTQKLGFWNATPIVQPAAAGQAALTPTTTITGSDTVDAAKTLTAIQNLETLVLAMRTALVNAGVIKGAA